MRNLLFAMFLLALLGCAREVEESARSIEEKILNARVQVYYLDTLHKTESGMYYMIQAKGTGEPVKKENYVYVRYSDLDLFENYSWTTENSVAKLLTNEERVAKQMGNFSYSTYYGPNLWITGIYALTEGIEEVMLTMREGDKRRIWLPSWLSSYGYEGSSQQYSGTTIHDIEILKVVTDIEQFQIDSLESYRDKRYPGVDSLSYGFYIKTLKEGTGDTLKTGDRVNIRYIGRLLDDFIFALNIADTAKRYNIYDSSTSYDVMEGECKEDGVFETIDSDGSSGSTVAGFSKAIFSMKHGEEAVVFFYSELGYGANLDKKRPAYFIFAPLVYWIQVERTNFDDEEDDEEKTTE